MAKTGQKVTLKAKPGQKKISFTKGGLHKSLGVPQGQKIPAAKMTAALAGKYGLKAKRQAEFAKNVLTGKKNKSKVKQAASNMRNRANMDMKGMNNG